MTIKQLQALFLKMQQFAGARGMIVTASLDGEPPYIWCRIEALDDPRLFHMLAIDDFDTEDSLFRRLAAHIQTIEAARTKVAA